MKTISIYLSLLFAGVLITNCNHASDSYLLGEPIYTLIGPSKEERTIVFNKIEKHSSLKEIVYDHKYSILSLNPHFVSIPRKNTTDSIKVDSWFGSIYDYTIGKGYMIRYQLSIDNLEIISTKNILDPSQEELTIARNELLSELGLEKAEEENYELRSALPPVIHTNSNKRALTFLYKKNDEREKIKYYGVILSETSPQIISLDDLFPDHEIDASTCGPAKFNLNPSL